MQLTTLFQLTGHGCFLQQWLNGTWPHSQTGFLELLKEEFIADRFRDATYQQAIRSQLDASAGHSSLIVVLRRRRRILWMRAYLFLGRTISKAA